MFDTNLQIPFHQQLELYNHQLLLYPLELSNDQRLPHLKRKVSSLYKEFELELSDRSHTIYFFVRGQIELLERNISAAKQFFNEAYIRLQYIDAVDTMLNLCICAYRSYAYSLCNETDRANAQWNEVYARILEGPGSEEIYVSLLVKYAKYFQLRNHALATIGEELTKILNRKSVVFSEHIYLDIGKFYLYDLNHPSMANVYLLKAVEYAEKKKNQNVILFSRIHLAFSYRMIKQHDKVINLLVPITKSSTEIDKNPYLLIVYETLITAYIQSKKFDQAAVTLREFDHKQVFFYGEQSVKQRVLFYLSKIEVMIFSPRQRLADAKFHIEMAKVALTNHKKEYFNQFYLIKLIILEAEVYKALNKMKLAIPLFAEAAQKSYDRGYLFMHATCNRLIAEIYDSNNEFEHAFSYYSVYKEALVQAYGKQNMQYSEALSTFLEIEKK
ncbi:MAG: hypothetical protein ACRCWQ_12315, partial [Bacilli bacterium]